MRQKKRRLARFRGKMGLLAIALAASLLMSCGPGGSSTPGAGTGSSGGPLLINGAGATFPYPLYSKWFDQYTKVDPSVRFNYQSIGSGGGIQQIVQRTVDFGASDAPLTDEQLKAAPAELLHIPTVIGAVVVIYNLPGVTSGLKLTPDALSGIYLGEITKWNDQKIAAQNPDLKLPDQAITVVHRSDGSGTTNIFTDYLSTVSPAWSAKVGKNTSVNWPVGLGAKGNEGVAGQVKQLPGSIGYTELAYASQNKLTYALLQNKDGNFIAPSIESTTAAAAGAAATMPEDLRVSIVNAPGKDAYPIAGYTYILVYREQTDQAKGKAMAQFLWWATHDGQSSAKDLLYAPLPADVVTKVEAKLRSMTFNGAPLL